MKNKLSNVVEKDLTIDSREVAKMLGKEHGDLLKDIHGSGKNLGIIPVLLKENFPVSDYFIESNYKDSSGKGNKFYYCTKMGCEMLGNKLQGAKGILFTAKYVKKFNQMENLVRDKQTQLSIKEIQELKNTLSELKKAIEEAKLQFIRPSHKQKLNYNKIIKSLTNSPEEVKIVKNLVFGLLGIEKWENTCIGDSKKIVKTITAVTKLLEIKKFDQLRLV